MNYVVRFNIEIPVTAVSKFDAIARAKFALRRKFNDLQGWKGGYSTLQVMEVETHTHHNDFDYAHEDAIFDPDDLQSADDQFQPVVNGEL